MNKKGSIKKIVSNILFYGITIFLVLYIVMSVIAPDKLYDTMNFKISTVISESMEPTIKKGDLIIVISDDKENIMENDIIVFNNYLPTTTGGYKQAEVVHRYIDTGESGNYITQGDNNDDRDVIRTSDGSVTELTYDQVVGKYAFRVPFIGWIPILISEHFDPMLFGLLVVNVVIIVALIKVLRKKPEDEEQKDEQNDLE